MTHITDEHKQIAYIYLLQDGKDRGTDIYKIGRTSERYQDTRTLTRLKNYSLNTIVYNIFQVPNCQVCKIENHIKTFFNTKYSLVRGSEWFQGNVYDMKKDIDLIIDEYHDKLMSDNEIDDDSLVNFEEHDTNQHTEMDIQQAIKLLSNEHHRYFTEQILYFKIDQTTPLKEYLQLIDNDVLTWFKSAPQNYTKESTFYKFKSPLHYLLQHKDVVKQYGHIYCSTLSNKITNTFSKHKKDFLKERNKDDVVIDNTKNTSYTSSETESDDGSEIDINELVPIDKTNNKDTQRTSAENNNELQYQIKLLQNKLDMQEKYYESIIEYYKTSNEQLMKLLGQIVSK